MDLVMVFGGLYVSLLRGLDPAGRELALDTLHHLATRETLSPGERDIFRKIVDSISSPPARPTFRVIKGGVA
jgi:hypothetical protein